MLQCGQPSSVLSRGRPAKLAASRSIPVSTTLPVAGHIKFNVAITTPLGPIIGHRERGRYQSDVRGRQAIGRSDFPARRCLGGNAAMIFARPHIRVELRQPSSSRQFLLLFPESNHGRLLHRAHPKSWFDRHASKASISRPKSDGCATFLLWSSANTDCAM